MSRIKIKSPKKIYVIISLLFFPVLFMMIGLYGAFIRIPAMESKSNEILKSKIGTLQPLHADFATPTSKCAWQKNGGMYSSPVCSGQSEGTAKMSFQEVENYLLASGWQLLASRKGDANESGFTMGLFANGDVCADVQQHRNIKVTAIVMGTGNYCTQLKASSKSW